MAEQLRFTAYQGVVAAPPNLKWIFNVSVPLTAPTLLPRWRAYKYDGTLVYNEQNIIELGLFATQQLAISACTQDYEFLWEAQNAPPPVLNTLTPNSGSHNTNVNVTLDGSGFDQGVVAIVTLSDGVSTDMQAPQDISTDTEFWITLPAQDILTPGTVQIAAENTDGKLSAALAFTAT